MIAIDKRSPVPLHHQIRSALENEILSGRLAPNDALPTEQQLCESLGVSRTTVRKAVLDLAQQGLVERKPALGTYVTERRKTRNTLVIATFGITASAPYPGGELFFFLWRGLAEAAARRGLEVSVRNADVPDAECGEVLRRLADEAPTFGLVVFTWRAVTWEQVRGLHEARSPYVLLNRYVPGREVPAVTLDDVAATAGAVRRLADFGHRRIAFVGNLSGSTTQQDRERGYREAMTALGLGDQLQIVHCEWHERAAREATARLLEGADPPTALLATSGYVATGAAAEAQRRGLKVPGDLSVIGFDDTARVIDTTPAITCVSYEPEAMGEAAVESLCRQAGGDLEQRGHRRIAAGLIERASCGPPA